MKKSLINGMISREWFENGPRMDRERSRITPMRPLLTMLALLMVCLFGVNEKAWGAGGTVKGVASVIEGKGSVKVRVERQRIYGWETAAEGSTVNQDSKDPSTAKHESGYAKQCVFSVVSEAKGYKFAGWYEEENNGSLTSKGGTWNITGPYVTSLVDRTYTYRAKFSPITYTISFNANPGTGTVVGTTGNVTGVKYDQDATLTKNGYKKIAYVVTYDAGGGSGLSKAKDSTFYDFDGWTKGSANYADEATVRNLSSTDGGTATLNAKWGSGTSSITLPPAPSVAKPYDLEGTGEYTFAGWYLSTDGTQTVIGVTGDSYTPTATVTLKAKWTAVKVPGFSAPGFVEGSKTLTVGGTYDDFIFSNTSTSTPSNLTTAKFYYRIFDEEVKTDNTDGCLEANKNKVISFDGTTITALNKGTAKIAFYQKDDTDKNIEERTSDTYTINVNKNVPSITFASAPYYYNATINNFYSSNNSTTSISAESDNTDVASISGTTLKTYNKAGTAQITVSQAENYYWAYHEESVDVTPQSKANHVTYTIANGNVEGIEVSKTSNAAWITDGSYKLGTGDWGTSKPDDNVIISLEGIPDKLSFTLSCDPVQIAGTHYPNKKDYTFEVYESATNGNWGNKKWGNNNSSDYSAPENVQVQLSPSTRYIKLRYNGTCWGRFSNITVSELQYFRRQGENTTLNFGSSLLNHVPAVQSFVVEHANAGYQTSVTAPEHYQVSLDNVNFASEVVYSTNATALTGGDKMGTFTVYVKYLANAEGTHAGNVTIHNNLRTDFTVPVTGTTQGKLSTTLHYIGASAYKADTTSLAATDLFEVRDANNVKVEGAVITLSTGTASSVILANDAKSIASLCGNSSEGTTGNVVASYAGDNTTYAAATNNGLSQNFTINRLNDEVSFDSGYGSMVVGEEIDLTEWVTSCTSGSDITVTSVFSDYIVIEGGKVKAIAKGDGRLRAVSAGNCTYNSGVKFLNIAVRNPEDPCGSSVLYSSKLIKVGAYSHTSSSPVTYGIPDGPQDKLTFKLWRVPTATQEATLEILDKNDNVLTNGTIEYAASSLPSSEPDAPNKEINMADYPGAKKLRFYGWGTLNKYFSEVRISQKAYLTASTSSVTMSTVKACETATGQFTLAYSDVSHIQLSQTNNDFTYEVWDGETKLIGFENGCKSYGTYTVKFFYTPKAKGDYSNTVTISASGKEQVITLNGTANAPEREIVWDLPTGNTITATQSVNLAAYAKTACQNPAGSVTYSYTSAVEGAATIEGSTITFNKAATVTVKASTVASDVYEDATPVEKVWTVGKVGTQMRTLPTITSTITYGDNSSVVTYDNNSWVAEEVLNNNEVKGHINYVGPASFTVVGPQNLTFNFTPDNVATYDVCQFTVPVTVQPKASVATPVAANITYGQRVNESVLSCGAGSTTAGSWAWKDEEANTQVLDARENVYTGLNVIFTPESNNYAPIETTVSLKVDKADPEVTPQASDIIYGQTISESDLTTASGDVDGTWSWAVDETQVLNAGEHNLTANFTSNDANYNNLSNVAVTLTVNKAASVATPTAAAITAGQKVSESALTNSGTEGTWVWDEAVANTKPAVGTYNYTVHFTPDNANYTTLTTTVSLKVNALVNEFTNAVGDGDWNNDSNWSSGSKPDGTENPDVIVSGQLIIDEDVTVGNLTIEPDGGITVVTNGTLTINGSSNDQSGYGDLYVKNGGEVDVVGSLKVGDLVVEASIGTESGNAKSGQVAKAEHIVYTNAYIDINMDPNGVMDDTKWYGFTVPFAVNAHNGVSRLEGSTIHQCVYGSDYLIAEYDAIKRLNSGNGWKFISGNTLNAGQFYFLTVDGSYNTYRFKASGSTYAPADDASLSINGDVTNYNANWNGVGNSTLQHVTASYAGGEYVQVYMNGKDAYKTVSTNDATFVVGCPFFIQAKEATTLSLDVQNSSTEKYYAPRHMQAKATGVAQISLSATEGGYSDQIYFSAVDKEQDAYIIGQDLAKAGVSDMVPQLWMAQYNQKLSVHEAAWNGNRAACSLGIYTPKAGTYELAIDAAPEDATLYLTYNGRAIWNLSMSAYEFDLEQGTTEGYGLRIVASEQTTTDIENGGLLNGENGVRKVMIDDVIYIVTPEGKMYDIVGKGIKF